MTSRFVILGAASYLAVGAGWWMVGRMRGRGPGLSPIATWPLQMLFPNGLR